MEHETFWTLATDIAHWEFELFLMLIFDVIIGLILWPVVRYFVWPKIKKACGCVVIHKTDADRIDELERLVAELRSERFGATTDFESDEFIGLEDPDDTSRGTLLPVGLATNPA